MTRPYGFIALHFKCKLIYMVWLYLTTAIIIKMAGLSTIIE